jgi:hypothetical protein
MRAHYAIKINKPDGNYGNIIGRHGAASPKPSAVLEILNGFFVLFGCFERVEGSQVPAFFSLRIGFPGIDAV